MFCTRIIEDLGLGYSTEVISQKIIKALIILQSKQNVQRLVKKLMHDQLQQQFTKLAEKIYSLRQELDNVRKIKDKSVEYAHKTTLQLIQTKQKLLQANYKVIESQEKYKKGKHKLQKKVVRLQEKIADLTRQKLRTDKLMTFQLHSQQLESQLLMDIIQCSEEEIRSIITLSIKDSDPAEHIQYLVIIKKNAKSALIAKVQRESEVERRKSDVI